MFDVSNLLSLLNEAQRQAATHLEGPALVLAGAGSGKTRVLTTRVAWLIQEHQVNPASILLVTFTNKAAQEMNKRVYELTGFTLPFAGTFHRIAAKILRQDGYHIGLSPGYTIYDTDDQLSLIKQIYKEHHFDQKEFNPKAVKGSISSAKNEMLHWEEYEKFAKGKYQEFTARVYKLYQRALREQQAVDFDDLLLLLVQLLQQNKEVLGKYQQNLTHVMIDEYQDTNKVQYQLTKLLTKPQDNLYVVGDFAQSIYAWRGADYRNMMLLKTDFVHIDEYKLEQNYRSTQTILDAATNVISQTTSHPVLSLWTEKSSQEKITLMECQSGEEEAQQVIAKIRKESRLYDYKDVVILYRTNAQSRPFEEAFVRAGIPYRLVGGFKFYERKEIKDVLAYLRLIINPSDSVSKERLIKLGKRKFLQFEDWLQSEIQKDSTLINESEKLIHRPPLELLKAILDSTKYLEIFDKDDPEDFSRIENVQELLNVAAQFRETATFLENVALVQDDYMADAATKDEANVVTLMSLHSAKGLEYPVVFMVGMEEGLLPHSRSLMDKEQMEEERRLCYVGITRAKEKLYLSYARQRWTYGSVSYALRSRFIADIPSELLHQEVLEGGRTHAYNSYDDSSYYGGYNHQRPFISKRSSKKVEDPPKPTRRIVVDDNDLEAILQGEMDIKAFLES
jgi:DNA helicase-2/ATP-dependent DNA helicase PcrA